MIMMTDVQNGTYKKLSKDAGVVAAVNSDSNINVSVYMSERDKFTSQFNTWSKKTAQSTLEMCRVVYEAKKELEGQDFLKFCNAIGRKGEDATVRKYLKIGEKYEQFNQYAELLPNSWTSIYEITQLPSEVFDALVATENSMANLTGEQIKLLKGSNSDGKSKSSTTAAAQTQASTNQSEVIDATSSKTDASGATTANSDLSETDSCVSGTDTSEFTTEATDDVPSTDTDREFAKQATSTVLAKANHAVTTTTVDVEDEEEFEPYEVTIRFNTKPSDAAIEELVESVLKIKSKYRVDFEIKTQRDHIM
jgi:hypothetical protein